MRVGFPAVMSARPATVGASADGFPVEPRWPVARIRAPGLPAHTAASTRHGSYPAADEIDRKDQTRAERIQGHVHVLAGRDRSQKNELRLRSGPARKGPRITGERTAIARLFDVDRDASPAAKTADRRRLLSREQTFTRRDHEGARQSLRRACGRRRIGVLTPKIKTRKKRLRRPGCLPGASAARPDRSALGAKGFAGRASPNSLPERAERVGQSPPQYSGSGRVREAGETSSKPRGSVRPL